MKIGIEDFAKVEIRVGQVKSAKSVESTDKLMHLMVDIGEAELRSIVAGIAKAYEPESLVGRKVVIVANLKPRKMRGHRVERNDRGGHRRRAAIRRWWDFPMTLRSGPACRDHRLALPSRRCVFRRGPRGGAGSGRARRAWI